MKFTETKVYNFEGAFRGMRAPKESWYKSDSFFGLINLENDFPDYDWVVDGWIEQENLIRAEEGKEPINDEMENYKVYYDLVEEYCKWMRGSGILNRSGDIADVAFLGPNDLSLAQKLIRAGAEHAKFLRQIFVSVDISAPIYWWKEMDTYKLGTTANSTSTMHKLTSKPITLDSFETDDYDRHLIIYNDDTDEYFNHWHLERYVERTIESLEDLRQMYLNTNDIKYWKELIRWLPESYIQTRTWTANYAVLRNIYFQRNNHKLTEWIQFCDWIFTLPYGGELITLGEYK